MRAVKHSRRVFITKHACGMCRVGKFMQWWKQQQSSDCPRCREYEDATHVWKCHGKGADDIWECYLVSLEGWFNSMHTDPDIQHMILEYLRGWRNDMTVSITNQFLFEELISDIEWIGWNQFFEGWLVQEWTRAQQAYYNSIKSLRTGELWAVALIKKQWDTAWDLWEHRNGILHEEQNKVVALEIHRINRNILEAFITLSSLPLPVHDRHIISIKLPKLLKKDRVFKECWPQNAMAIINGRCHFQWSKRHSTAALIRGMQNSMRRFLGGRRPTIRTHQ